MEDDTPAEIEARDFGRELANEMIKVLKQELEARNFSGEAQMDFWQGVEDGLSNV